LAASSCAISASTSGRRCSSGRLSGLDVRQGHVAAPRLDARALEGLVADQHRDAMARHRCNRLQRRNLRACRFHIGLRALHVEGRCQACPMARLHQAQRLVISGGNRAQRVEAALCTDQREVVAGDIAHHQQTHAAHASSAASASAAAAAVPARRRPLKSTSHATSRPALPLRVSGISCFTAV
jgi:hypothetical protein